MCCVLVLRLAPISSIDCICCVPVFLDQVVYYRESKKVSSLDFGLTRNKRLTQVSDFSARWEQGGTTAQRLHVPVSRFSARLCFRMIIQSILNNISGGIIFLAARSVIFMIFLVKSKGFLRFATLEEVRKGSKSKENFWFFKENHEKLRCRPLEKLFHQKYYLKYFVWSIESIILQKTEKLGPVTVMWHLTLCWNHLPWVPRVVRNRIQC